MSRRRRTARRSATQVQGAWRKALRRRARRVRSVATAATAAAATLAGSGSALAAAEVELAVEAARVTAASTAQCLSGVPSSNPGELEIVGDTLYFAAGDGVHGRELWKSDGTEAGTVLVENINPHDTERRPGSRPRQLTDIGGLLFFSADDGAHGRELWASDGTEAGTVLVKNINRDRPKRIAGSTPKHFTEARGQLFFSAQDHTHGRELWKTDGTRPGTTMVRDIAPAGARFLAAVPPTSPSCVGGCSSPQMTAPTEASCGGRTAAGQAP